MKICFFLYPLREKSGWSRYGRDIVAGARQEGHEVKTVEAYDQARSLLRAVPALFLRAWSCDVLYAIDGWPYGAIAWAVSRVCGVRLIVGGIGTYSLAPLFRKKSSRWV